MPASKVRATGLIGPTNPLTGQPVDGRAKGGGMKIGEMEHYVLRAVGANALAVELAHRKMVAER